MAIIYAANLKQEVSNIKDLNAKLLTQLKGQQQISERQLAISEAMIDLSHQQLEIAKSTLGETQSMDGKLEHSLDIQERLLSVAESTLQQARDINSKMPPGTSPSSLSL